MACPFDERPVDIGAQIIRAIHRERLIRPRLDILSFPEDFLLERYRFSHDSLQYLNNLLQPYIANVTNRGSALSSLQTSFFSTGSFLYSVGDAEHIGKATVCRSVGYVKFVLRWSGCCVTSSFFQAINPRDAWKWSFTNLQVSIIYFKCSQMAPKLSLLTFHLGVVFQDFQM